MQTFSLRLNVPNAITAVRIFLAAVIVSLLIKGGAATITAGIVLIIAWTTDWLDGFLARRLRQSTSSGALFDVAADMLLVTSVLITSVILGLWSRASGLMLINPYPFAAVVIGADLTVLVGVFTFIRKRSYQAIDFPPPTHTTRIAYSVQMTTLLVGILGIGPDMLLAVLMYLTIIFTLFAFYSFLKKGSHIFAH
jgi:CDP-diacylglycerol--glycerol-3-phosphate 3-phosphatidyltransferase